MLFHSSIRRELARSFGATLLVLFTIVITMLLIRTLGLANKGSVNPQEILLVLTYTVLGRLPMVLTLALFIAIVSTLSRMYRESEMVIWLASGRGLASFLSPILRFAWPILLVTTLMVLFVWPWANEQTDLMRDRYERRSDLERIEPGLFQETAGGRRVFFIDKDTVNGQEGRNIFISSIDAKGQENITSARSGRIEWQEDQQYLMLSHGQRLDSPPTGELRVSEFESYGILVGNQGRANGPGLTLKSIPTWQLLTQSDRGSQSEWSWRLGMAWTALNFVLLALAVSASNPRAGRSGNLVFMLFAFVFYYNLLNMGQGWVAAGLVRWWTFMLGLHGGVMAMSLLWLAKRHCNWVWWPQRRYRKGTAT